MLSYQRIAGPGNRQPENLYHTKIQDSLSAAFTAHDNKRIANAYFELSRYYQEIALDKRKAMEYLNNSFYHYKLVKDSASIIRGKERFAEILEAAELHENALIFLEEALNYYQRRNRQKQVMRIMERISSVYEGMGEYEKQGAYIKKASEINEILKDSLMSLMLLIDKTNTSITGSMTVPWPRHTSRWNSAGYCAIPLSQPQPVSLRPDPPV